MSIWKGLVETRRNIKILINDNVRVRAKCVGTVPCVDDGTVESSIGKRKDKVLDMGNQDKQKVLDKANKGKKVGISKYKAFGAKAKAEETLKGDVELQYGMLRDYVMELKKCNPNTIINIYVYDVLSCRHRYAVSFLMDTAYWMSE
ncbi:hypothetical protein Tco_0908831 [Tanacetum coccineum]|uniref:Uncharacterized protein n=1 Tax=Tanacetum coccineum TaxID=301880 RepID=A0ABQ5CNA5_9ASTR